MAIFNEANMIATIEKHLPAGQHFKAGIHAVAKKVRLCRSFSNATYDSPNNLILPLPEAPLLYMVKRKEAAFDVYMGFSEDYLVIVPCQREMWYYESEKITDSELAKKMMPFAIKVEAPLNAFDILPVYRISQIDKCSIKKNWIGAYVCKIEFDNDDFLKVLLPPLAGLFGGMPNHKMYRDVILELLKKKL